MYSNLNIKEKVMEFKIGKKIYGISINQFGYYKYVRFFGNIISLDENTIAIWGTEPNHNDIYEDNYEKENPKMTMLFVDIRDEFLFDNEEEMQIKWDKISSLNDV
jgi:hypothetical protein